MLKLARYTTYLIKTHYFHFIILISLSYLTDVVIFNWNRKSTGSKFNYHLSSKVSFKKRLVGFNWFSGWKFTVLSVFEKTGSKPEVCQWSKISPNNLRPRLTQIKDQDLPKCSILIWSLSIFWPFLTMCVVKSGQNDHFWEN